VSNQEKGSKTERKKFRAGQGENPLFGWFIFSILCLIAYYYDVSLGLITIATIGYAISRS